MHTACAESFYRPRVDTPGVSSWYRTWTGWVVVSVYAVLTVAGVAVSAGLFVGTDAFTTPDSGARVPWFVYLYGLLGAMAYAFTSLLSGLGEAGEASVRRLVRIGLRVLAALPLAGGVYLLAALLSLPTSGRTAGGLAFLVGLYVSLTLKALGGLAERLYGAAGGSGAAQSGERTADDDA